MHAVLTRLPRSPHISPGEARQLIQDNVSSVAKVITLTGDDFISLIEQLAQVNIIGGAVYDGVIAKVAEMADVDHLLTLNLPHFQRVWPAGSSKIISPQTCSPP